MPNDGDYKCVGYKAHVTVFVALILDLGVEQERSFFMTWL